MMINTTPLQQALINQYQKGFPLSSRPYLEVAEQLNDQDARLNCTEQDVIDALNELDNNNVLSRLGPVFDHKKAGASTLAAVAVPEAEMDGIAAVINQFDSVNHNYARTHDYNIWFVVTAANDDALQQELQQIELQTGYPVLVLPMETAYHIDLSFQINFNELPVVKANEAPTTTAEALA